MDASLLQLMEDLLQAIEQRDASDPDAPAWEAVIRIHRLEEELTARLGSEEALRLNMASARGALPRSEGALSGVV